MGEGETFASIAQSYYGSTRYDTALWWHNRRQVNWPDQLAPGDSLIMPSARDIKSTLDQIGGGRSTPSAGRPNPPAKINPDRTQPKAREPNATTAPRSGSTRGQAERRPFCRISTVVAGGRLGARAALAQRAGAGRLDARAAGATGAEPRSSYRAGSDQRSAAAPLF